MPAAPRFETVSQLLYHEAGLLGLSGVSGDMRKLHAAGSEAATAAIELFAYRVATEAGALAAALGGVDGFVFTGGIGEHDAEVRRMVVDRLGWLGLSLDAEAPSAGRVSRPGAAAEVWVIPTDEEAVIERQTSMVVGVSGSPAPSRSPPLGSLPPAPPAG